MDFVNDEQRCETAHAVWIGKVCHAKSIDLFGDWLLEPHVVANKHSKRDPKRRHKCDSIRDFGLGELWHSVNVRFVVNGKKKAVPVEGRIRVEVCLLDFIEHTKVDDNVEPILLRRARGPVRVLIC